MLHLAPMFFYDWLQRPNSSTHNDDSNNEAMEGDNHLTDSNEITMVQLVLEASKQLDELHRKNQLDDDSSDDSNKDNSNSQNGDTITTTLEGDSDMSHKFLRAWSNSKKSSGDNRSESEQDNDEMNISDASDDVEPLKKIPFFSLDLKLDETEHSEEDLTESEERDCFVLHTGEATAWTAPLADTVNHQLNQPELTLPAPEEDEEQEDDDVPFFSLDLRLGLDQTERSEEEQEETTECENDKAAFFLHTGAPLLEHQTILSETLSSSCSYLLDDCDDDESLAMEHILDDRDDDFFFAHQSSSSPILEVLSASKARLSSACTSPAVQKLIARVSSPVNDNPDACGAQPSQKDETCHDDTQHATGGGDLLQDHHEPLHTRSSPLIQKSSQHQSELSGPGPAIAHRTPIPTWISFTICLHTNIENTTATLSSQQANREGEEGEEKVDHAEQPHDGCTTTAPLNEILDPTDPLICGKITSSSYLQTVANRMDQFLLAASDDDIDTLCRDSIAWMRQHPMVCQVKYRPPEFHGYTYLLSYFSAAGWLEGCQLAYHAFPEAIGQDDNNTGLPLHYACLHQAGYNVISFLVEKYPEAARITNNHQHETPLHLYCRSICGGDDDAAAYNDDDGSDDCHNSTDESNQLKVIELLLHHYPTAAQLADLDGFTPFHLACRQRHVRLSVLKALQASSSPSVIATRCWQRPAHIAARNGAPYPVMEWLLQTDPTVSRTTVEDFSTVLHCAVEGHCSVDVLKMIRDAHPVALTWTNSKDETPLDVAEKVGAGPEILQLLAVPDSKSDCASNDYFD